MEEQSIEIPLHVDDFGSSDPRIPFHAFVNPSFYLAFANAETYPPSFHLWSGLPAELQLAIMQWCDPPTLFRLMRTSSNIRSMAKSLFWSYQDTWYLEEAEVIHKIITGRQTGAVCDTFRNVALNIQQVEIDCGNAGLSVWKEWILPNDSDRFVRRADDWYYDRLIDNNQRHSHDDSDTNDSDSQLDQYGFNEEDRSVQRRIAQEPTEKTFSNEQAADIFWKTFKTRYPSIRRVVITDRNPKIGYQNQETREFRPECVSLYRALEPHVEVFVAAVQPKIYGNKRGAKVLYQLDANSHWSLVRIAWTRFRVDVPISKPEGVVGEYFRIGDRERELTLRHQLLPKLRATIYDMYHFQNGRNIPFVCPHPNCQQEFHKPGEYGPHSHPYGVPPSHRHDGWLDHRAIRRIPNFPSLLPHILEKELTAMEKAYEVAQETLQNDQEQQRKAWGAPNSIERQRYTEAFLTQLRDDPLYAGPKYEVVERHLIWRCFKGLLPA